MDPSQIGILVTIIIMIIMSGFFSASEMAFSTANKIRLRTLEADGNRSAKRVLSLLDRYDRLLSTILIGNNIVNIVASTLATLLFAGLIKNEQVAAVVSTAAVTIAVLIFGEITPKTLAKNFAEGFAMRIWPILWFFVIILFPIDIFLVPWKKLIGRIRNKNASAITEDELITYVETAQNEGGIDAHESQLIRSAIEFEDLDVNDIMVPRVNVVAIEEGEPFDAIADLFLDNGFSRLPVYSKTIDSIIGIIHEKDFYKLYRLPQSERPASIKGIVQPVVCVSPSMKISTVLRMLQKAKIHMAIVVDEFGGTEGIVTLEDILEELVGEIYDEHDEVEVLSRKVGEDTYLVSGTHNLEELFEAFGMNVREEFDSTTVGGWLTEQLGKIPAAGEKLTFENLEITVAKANNKRVLEVKIKVNPVQEEQESGLEKILGAVREKMKEKTDKDENRESPEPTLIGAGDTEENTETEGQSTKGFTDEELAAYDGRPESET
ncbi:MAG: HlyC/CorC family transporter [Clostridia bacterium]|nr:HlyC/CorC family transporter [Clostridia bacterium]